MYIKLATSSKTSPIAVLNYCSEHFDVCVPGRVDGNTEIRRVKVRYRHLGVVDVKQRPSPEDMSEFLSDSFERNTINFFVEKSTKSRGSSIPVFVNKVVA